MRPRIEQILRRPVVAVVMALAMLAGCDRSAGGGPAATEPLLVMAATSLGETMATLAARFEAATGVRVVLSVGATGSLAAQMEHGAPADLFFSADRSTVERLVANGTIARESVQDFAVGDLVILWRTGLQGPASLTDLAASRFGTIALANPETAPYGAAAREALQRAGIWGTVAPRIVQGEGVAQTYHLVRTGNVDAALVARSLVNPSESSYLPVDPALHAPIVHALGILTDGRREEAERFVDFVLSVEGQAILDDHGFRPAPLRP